MYVWSTLLAECDIDQPGVIASPARGHLKKREGHFSVLAVSRDRFSGPVPCQPAAHSPHSRLNVVLTYYGVPPHTVLLLYVEQTAPAAAERENCAIHFHGFLGFNASLTAAAFRTTD